MMWTYILLCIAVFLIGSFVFTSNIYNEKIVKILLAFSGSFLLAISMLHLLPEVYETAGIKAGYFVLAGFIIQLLIEIFSKGIEHGHIHVHKHEHHFPYGVFIGLSLHSLLEGMPINFSGVVEVGHNHSSSLLTGIFLHKLPIAIVLGVLFAKSGVSKIKGIFYLFLFAAMMPIGTLLSVFLGTTSLPFDTYQPLIVGLVIGIFLHVSTTILFEASENHRFNLMKFVSILLGFFVAIFTL